MTRLVIKRWPDGKYLVSYDPDWQPDPLPDRALEWECGISEWSVDPNDAIIFGSVTEAKDFWCQQSTLHPTRGDGQPNRPLTRYSIEIEAAPPIPGEADDASTGAADAAQT